MAKLYFHGGEDIKKRDSKKIDKRAFADAGKAPTILIFPWTRKIEKIEYRAIISDYFKELGASKIKFAELSDSHQKIKRKIESSDLIYLPGGDDRILVNRLKKRKIDALFQKYNKVIIGNSAGSLALCKKYVVIKGQEGEPKTEAREAIGLVNFAVAVHYKSTNPRFSGQAPCKELKALSKKMDIKIYAIPERCALVYTNGKLQFIGNIYLFYKGRKTKCK